MAQKVKQKRTLIKFACQSTGYIEGEGTSTDWVLVQVPIGFDKEKQENIMTDCFYCEWLGAYGANAIQQQSDGSIESARVRMPFVKEVYDALKTKDVKIFKHGIEDTEHTFCLNSSADNYLDGNKMLEFQVKRREVK